MTTLEWIGLFVGGWVAALIVILYTLNYMGKREETLRRDMEKRHIKKYMEEREEENEE